MGEFQHGLFGCFDNLGLCIITYFVPCYTFGKNAEMMGHSCVLYGLSYIFPLAALILRVMVRGEIREKNGIDGGCVGDCLQVAFCHLCSLVQEAQEVQSPGGVAMARS